MGLVVQKRDIVDRHDTGEQHVTVKAESRVLMF